MKNVTIPFSTSRLVSAQSWWSPAAVFVELLNQTGSPQAGKTEDQDRKETGQLACAGWVYSAFKKWGFNGKTMVKPSVKQPQDSALADLISLEEGSPQMMRQRSQLRSEGLNK